MNQSAEKITNLKTELYSFHIANGGKMVPFAGYDMPVQYSEGIIKEHQHVRSAVGIFDVSHMGQFSIFGNEIIEIEANKNLTIKDLTGAGDLFAAGYLHGFINNLSVGNCLELGTKLSSKVIQQIGARL